MGTPGGGGVDSTFDLFSVRTAWGEGSGAGNNGSAASAGEATWNNALHGTSPWTAPGGTIGTDYAAASSASTFVSGTGSYQWTGAGIASDVQGWVLISQSEGVANTVRRFGSREGGAVASLPIDFTAIPEPSIGALFLLGLLALGKWRKR